jgi:hypothetical protein
LRGPRSLGVPAVDDRRPVSLFAEDAQECACRARGEQWWRRTAVDMHDQRGMPSVRDVHRRHRSSHHTGLSRATSPLPAAGAGLASRPDRARPRHRLTSHRTVPSIATHDARAVASADSGRRGIRSSSQVLGSHPDIDRARPRLARKVPTKNLRGARTSVPLVGGQQICPVAARRRCPPRATTADTIQRLWFGLGGSPQA